MCGQNAGTALCRYCYRMTCVHCHHGPKHLNTCPDTAQKETGRR